MLSALRRAGGRCVLQQRPAATSSERIAALSSEVDGILKGSNFKERGLGSMQEHTAARQFVAGLSASSQENIVVECIRQELKDNEFDMFLRRLPSDDVRAVAIAALSRTFNQDFKTIFKELDTNKDGQISMTEIKRYLVGLSEGGALGGSEPPTRRQYLLFGLNSAIPFVVFGALDNSIMILGGDVIDDLIGGYMKLSTLACAALANTFADVFGISIGNSVEAFTKKLGLPGAKLTAGQKELPAVRRVGLFSSSFGIFVGCIIGMTPLLFMEQKCEKEGHRG